jgi:hypothetical protein
VWGVVVGWLVTDWLIFGLIVCPGLAGDFGLGEHGHGA